MRFFKRDDKKPPDPPSEGWPAPGMELRPPEPQPEPEPEQTGPVRKVEGGFSLHIETVEDAKQAIVELKDKKRELQTMKKEVSAEQADVRAGHAEKRAGRIVMPRGGGTFGRIVRGGVQSSRRSDRMKMQQEVQAYNDAKARIDQDIRQLDAAIAQMQTYVSDNAPAKTTRVAATKPAPVNEVADRLKALSDLKDAGLITDEEFASKRAELLARL